MAIATGSQIRPELSAVDYTPFLQASGQAAQMQAQGITSAVGGALKGFESIVQQQKENKQLDAEIKSAERLGNSLQPFLKDVSPEAQTQFGKIIAGVSDPNLSLRERSANAKGISTALNNIISLAELGKKTQDEKATAEYAGMLNTGGGKIPSPVSNDALDKYTPAQKLAAEERYLRQAEARAKLGQIEAQTKSIGAKDAAALQKAELAKNKALIEDAANARALGVAFDDSNMTPAQVRAAEVLSEGIKKTTGLDEKNNYEAYKQALASAEGMPLGPERQALVLDSYLKNGGAANPDFLKKIGEMSKSPYQITKLGSFTFVEANGTTRVIDNTMKLADVKNVEREQYSKLLSETAKSYDKWVQIPLDVRELLMASNEKYPSKQKDMFGPAPNGKAVWEQYRASLLGTDDPKEPGKPIEQGDPSTGPRPMYGEYSSDGATSPSLSESVNADGSPGYPPSSPTEPQFTPIPGSGGWKIMTPPDAVSPSSPLSSSGGSFEPQALPNVDRIALESARSGFDRAISSQNQEFALPQIKLSREAKALAEKLRERSDDYSAISEKRSAPPRLSASENGGKSGSLNRGKTITLDRDGIEAILFDPSILVELIGGKAGGPSPKLIRSGQRVIGPGAAAPRLK